MQVNSKNFSYLTIHVKACMTHTALSDVGGEVLLQDASLSLGGLQLHIFLVEH